MATKRSEIDFKKHLIILASSFPAPDTQKGEHNISCSVLGVDHASCWSRKYSQEGAGFPWISPESQGRLLGIRWAMLLGGGPDSNERRALRPLPQIHPGGAMATGRDERERGGSANF